MKKLFLVCFLFPLLSFSQVDGLQLVLTILEGVVDAIVLEDTLFNEQSPVVTFEDSYDGMFVYEKDTIYSHFNVKNSFIYDEVYEVDLFDEKLKSFELYGENSSDLRVVRLKDVDNKLCRVLIDTVGVKVYDFKLTFNSSDFQKRNLLFQYNDNFVWVKRNIFRKFEKNLDKTFEKVAIDDKALEQYLKNYLVSCDD